jgi:sulfur-carrier protein
MKVRVRYFASLREALGAGETLDLGATNSATDSTTATVATLRETLLQRSPEHAQALARGRALRCALNQTLCEESALLSEGAEVAFFPPVTGG